MHFYPIFVLVFLFDPAYCRFFCGIEPVTANWMEIFIKLDCPKLLKQHQECCKTHGWCYIHKKKKLEICDAEYCQCSGALSKDGVCKTHSDNFCGTVKNIGHMTWPMINKYAMDV